MNTRICAADTATACLPPMEDCWWPAAFAHQLKSNRSRRVLVCEQPLVLFRDASGQVAALPDRCPHRFAPLSAGQVIGGEVQCPYHGWSFNAAGQCVRVPGSPDACTHAALLVPWHCREAGGLIWVNRSDNTGAIAGVDDGLGIDSNTDSFWLSAEVESDLLDAAENFLDAYHTHFVHRGWIRRDKNRQPLHALRLSLADGIEVEYRDEPGQNGWLSRLLETRRGKSWGRFRWPNLAEVEYCDIHERLSFAASVWLVPSGKNSLQLFARISTGRGICPRIIKRIALTLLFKPVLEQDRAILALTKRNKQTFDDQPKPLDADHDLMGPALRQLFRERCPQAIPPKERTLWL